MRENQHSNGEGNEPNEFYWWRTCATPEEISSLKVTTPSDLGCLTPRLKVMREMERLAIVASESYDFRHKVMAYRVGDLWVPMGGVKKEDMEFPSLITILLVGYTGGGKSSLVNLMYSVLGNAGIIPFAQTSGSSSVNSESTTMFLEEHNVLRSIRAGFCVYDSRGFDYNDRGDDTLHDLNEWTGQGVKHKKVCCRSKDEASLIDVGSTSTSRKFVKRQVNCAMVVANMAYLYDRLNAGDSKALESTKDLFSFQGLKKGNQNPILVLTHGDKLSAEERIDARIKICRIMGISETSGVYDIVCLTECGVVAEECDPVTAYALTEAVYRGLLISDMSHLPKRNFKDRAIFVLSWLLCLIGGFFAFLARLFGNNSQRQNKFKST